jgi:hypothetical protein
MGYVFNQLILVTFTSSCKMAKLQKAKRLKSNGGSSQKIKKKRNPMAVSSIPIR